MSLAVEPGISRGCLSILDHLILVICNVASERYHPVFTELLGIFERCFEAFVFNHTHVCEGVCLKTVQQRKVLAFHEDAVATFLEEVDNNRKFGTAEEVEFDAEVLLVHARPLGFIAVC